MQKKYMLHKDKADFDIRTGKVRRERESERALGVNARRVVGKLVTEVCLLPYL
jgi:hypothetical protein